MELMFIGADHEVTGSCHYLRVGDKNILVDYGMEQGIKVLAKLPIDPKIAQLVDAGKIEYLEEGWLDDAVSAVEEI